MAQEPGWHEWIAARRGAGCPVFGICGGYQMLGESVSDPHGVEGDPTEEAGLGLLSVRTVLREVKELAQVEGRTTSALPFVAEDTAFRGYEIHAGDTSQNGETPFMICSRRGVDVEEEAGAVSDDGMVAGCYVHGIFDSAVLRHQLVAWLYRRRGLEWPGAGDDEADDPYDRFADLIEEHIDLGALSALREKALF